MKITKKDFLKEIKDHIDPRCTQLRSAHRSYSSENIPTFHEITSGSNQPTQDLTKMINPIIMNMVYGYLDIRKGCSCKKEENGLDLFYHGKEIEAKIACAKKGVVDGWVGNKTSHKVPMHLLIGYSVNGETVDGLFVALIDLSQTKETKWSGHYSERSGFSSLKVHQVDNDKIHVLIGSRKQMQRKSKYQHFLVEKI